MDEQIDKATKRYRKYHAIANKHWRDRNKQNGICVSCGRNYAEPGYVRCKPCYIKARRGEKKRDPDGTIHRDYVRELRQKRKDAGLCVDCGKRKPQEGYVRCAICIKKDRERREVYKIRNRIKKQNSERMKRNEKAH